MEDDDAGPDGDDGDGNEWKFNVELSIREPFTDELRRRVRFGVGDRGRGGREESMSLDLTKFANIALISACSAESNAIAANTGSEAVVVAETAVAAGRIVGAGSVAGDSSVSMFSTIDSATCGISSTG